MARIAGVNIPQDKVVHIALTYIHGIGNFNSKLICEKLNKIVIIEQNKILFLEKWKKLKIVLTDKKIIKLNNSNKIICEKPIGKNK